MDTSNDTAILTDYQRYPALTTELVDYETKFVNTGYVDGKSTWSANGYPIEAAGRYAVVIPELNDAQAHSRLFMKGNIVLGLRDMYLPTEQRNDAVLREKVTEIYRRQHKRLREAHQRYVEEEARIIDEAAHAYRALNVTPAHAYNLTPQAKMFVFNGARHEWCEEKE